MNKRIRIDLNNKLWVYISNFNYSKNMSIICIIHVHLGTEKGYVWYALNEGIFRLI